MQFVGDGDYAIGRITRGIDGEKRQRLYYINEAEKPSCEGCALKGRCSYHCGCLNRQSTGSIANVSPALCAHERIFLPITGKRQLPDVVRAAFRINT